MIPAPGLSFFKKVKLLLDSGAKVPPFSVAKYYSSEMAKTVGKLIEKHNFDLVHVDHIHMTHYVDHFAGRPCLVDEHNVEYKIMERCGNVERTWWKQQLYFQQASKMKRFERNMVLRSPGARPFPMTTRMF
jgi:hypothetical protein